jgi:hypothetical protein
MNHSSVSGVIVVFVIGIIFAGYGTWRMVDESKFRRRAMVTAGTIVGHQKGLPFSDNASYYCIVEFIVVDGTVTRGRTRRASSLAAGRVGSAATVYYNPAKPAEIEIATRRTPVLTMLRVISIVSGLAALIVGVLILTGQISLTEGSGPALVELGR